MWIQSTYVLIRGRSLRSWTGGGQRWRGDVTTESGGFLEVDGSGTGTGWGRSGKGRRRSGAFEGDATRGRNRLGCRDGGEGGGGRRDGMAWCGIDVCEKSGEAGQGVNTGSCKACAAHQEAVVEQRLLRDYRARWGCDAADEDGGE